MMRAVSIRQLGPAGDHAVVELPDFEPKAGWVIVDVKAAAVNYPDLLVITGRYQVVPPLPFTPGKDAAGVVRSVGPGVERVRPGDRVLVHMEHGAFATQAQVREELCLALPDDMDFADATALGLAAQTAWFALVERGAYRPGETVLVNGATGAVGFAAVQIAAALGATVLAGVHAPERDGRGERLLAAGAHGLIDLSAPDLRDCLREQVQARTGGRGADVVIDMLGGDVFDASLRALAWAGRIVVVGFAEGRIPTLKANYLLVKNITACGLQWSDYREREPGLVAKAHAALVAMSLRGALRPAGLQRLALDDFAHALHLIDARKAVGRVVLTMD